MKTVSDLISFLSTLDQDKPICMLGVGIDSKKKEIVGTRSIEIKENSIQDNGDCYEISPLF